MTRKEFSKAKPVSRPILTFSIARAKRCSYESYQLELTFMVGSVGSLVMIIQLAKIDGLKVIGSAGSGEKVQSTCLRSAIIWTSQHRYWDNVGGATLDAALEAASKGARFIECGMISGYNTGGLQNQLLHMSGFIVDDLYPECAEEPLSNQMRRPGEVKSLDEGSAESKNSNSNVEGYIVAISHLVHDLGKEVRSRTYHTLPRGWSKNFCSLAIKGSRLTKYDSPSDSDFLTYT
ncbi:hypothetical protein BDN70DRAFT_898977 [Pholiota conissans]|uniref:Alcohol dehydrogenase-like C-terminal domain-containing protein n=1 Tax=Pholiota conissans TaxID=109636 RepID=A0A9P5YSR1_9AGAR|nr:hypothetical protein BDN70DRAFT_898977 [Pholiota conissans]